MYCLVLEALSGVSAEFFLGVERGGTSVLMGYLGEQPVRAMPSQSKVGPNNSFLSTESLMICPKSYRQQSR